MWVNELGMVDEMVVMVLLGGVDRMCFRDPRRLMVVEVVGRMVVVVVVVDQLGGVFRVRVLSASST